MVNVKGKKRVFAMVYHRLLLLWPDAHNSRITWYIFDQFCIEMHTYTFNHFLGIGMQNSDEAWLSISLAGRGQLVKLLITLEPHGIFLLNFAYLNILRLSSVYQTKLNNNRQQELCRSKQF